MRKSENFKIEVMRLNGKPVKVIVPKREISLEEFMKKCYKIMKKSQKLAF